MTDDCLEEALANGWSHNRLTHQLASGGFGSLCRTRDETERVLRITEDWLGFGPPGYRQMAGRLQSRDMEKACNAGHDRSLEG